MKTKIGLWIDHRNAILVTITDKGEEIKKIESGMEKHVRFTGGRGSEDGSSEDVRDHQFENHLNKYYDEIIVLIREADSIRIFGPGEAKIELEKRIIHKGLKAQILEIENADKMTDRQIAAKAREYFST